MQEWQDQKQSQTLRKSISNAKKRRGRKDWKRRERRKNVPRTSIMCRTRETTVWIT
jgi:hypothetical protein